MLSRLNPARYISKYQANVKHNPICSTGHYLSILYFFKTVWTEILKEIHENTGEESKSQCFSSEIILPFFELLFKDKTLTTVPHRMKDIRKKVILLGTKIPVAEIQPFPDSRHKRKAGFSSIPQIHSPQCWQVSTCCLKEYQWKKHTWHSELL